MLKKGGGGWSVVRVPDSALVPEGAGVHYARLAVCMWASVSMRRAALCAASVSSWGGTVRNARVLHVACRFSLLSHSELTVLEGSSGSDDGPVVSVVPEVI